MDRLGPDAGAAPAVVRDARAAGQGFGAGVVPAHPHARRAGMCVRVCVYVRVCVTLIFVGLDGMTLDYKSVSSLNTMYAA